MRRPDVEGTLWFVAAGYLPAAQALINHWRTGK